MLTYRHSSFDPDNVPIRKTMVPLSHFTGKETQSSHLQVGIRASDSVGAANA